MTAHLQCAKLAQYFQVIRIGEEQHFDPVLWIRDDEIAVWHADLQVLTVLTAEPEGGWLVSTWLAGPDRNNQILDGDTAALAASVLVLEPPARATRIESSWQTYVEASGSTRTDQPAPAGMFGGDNGAYWELMFKTMAEAEAARGIAAPKG